jgi:hypothetical protein
MCHGVLLSAQRGGAFQRLGLSPEVLLVIFGIFGGLCLPLGIVCCLKRIWAVYIGLVFSCIMLAFQFLGGNVVAIGLWSACIVLSILAIMSSRKLKAAGIPLTMKPRELMARMYAAQQQQPLWQTPPWQMRPGS